MDRIVKVQLLAAGKLRISIASQSNQWFKIIDTKIPHEVETDDAVRVTDHANEEGAELMSHDKEDVKSAETKEK